MARVFIDGFEAGDLKLWDLVVGAWIVQRHLPAWTARTA